MKQQKADPELSLSGALRYFLKGNLVFVTSGIIIYLIDTPSRFFPSLFQKVYTDNIITHKNPEWFVPLLTFYVLLFVFVLTVWVSLSRWYEGRAMPGSSLTRPQNICGQSCGCR
jgi:hypothetical protein